ncbi:glutamate carboxypeptidase [Methylobacterium sp. Leaf104]|uniref:glutamate carboxypeptidase n=1 Tax=Methylobacterium TaxID=407 RepID=UPI0006F40D9C|nr:MULTISPECIES: glutamate carboxypeptidase [Methylobacterium]KQP33629.1 glutamate carboxypeptidase [Methylobacterium sp. Leaf104]MCI9879834.1 M20/M25/M40 family metallo-hydrolase [Methylobacterium goesingense]
MRPNAALALALLVILSPVAAWAAPDEAVLAAVKAQDGPYRETLKGLVDVDTGTGDVPGLAKVEAVLRSRLEAAGLAVESRAAPAFGGNTLIGTRSGTGTRKIMLLVHYDTVFATGDAAKRPYTERDSRAYGPGVADAKGGIAMILHLMAALETLRFDRYGTLTVVFNPDEERGSRGSRDEIARVAREQDVVLSFEPSFADAGVDAVTVATKGINYASLTVKGRASHAGGAPEAGRNAVVELAHQILQLQDLGDSGKGTSLHWTVVQGGTKPNIIPEAARAEGDMRYFVPGEYDRVLTQARRIVGSHRVPDTQVSFDLARGRPPLPQNPATQALGERARAIYGELGAPLALAEIGGGTDAGYAFQPDSPAKPALLESLGIVGGHYHSADEFAVLASITPRLYLATRLVMEVSQESGR